jgi:hypothetical protein
MIMKKVTENAKLKVYDTKAPSTGDCQCQMWGEYFNSLGKAAKFVKNDAVIPDTTMCACKSVVSVLKNRKRDYEYVLASAVLRRAERVPKAAASGLEDGV